MTLKRTFLTILLTVSSALFATDYYANNVTGKDDFDGKAAEVSGKSGPMLTINRAVKLLKPGDTLHLANTGKVYRQSVNIPGNISGTAKKKITIDGHGAWLTCAEHLPTSRWVPAKLGPKGTLRLTGLKGRYDFGIILLLEREKIPGFGDPDALKPGEFWYLAKFNILYCLTSPTFRDSTITITQTDGKTVEAPPAKWGGTNYKHIGKLKRFRGLSKPPKSILVNGKPAPLLAHPALDNLPEGRYCLLNNQDLYYHPPSGKKIGDLNMMALFRSSGVAINGGNQHLVVKNFNVAYTTNDGYNIHGKARSILFQNCNAFFAGDEGYSSHDQCETTLDGGVLLACNNGIQNVNRASTVIRNVIIDNAGLRNDPGTVNNVVENVILIDCGLGTSNSKVDNILSVNSKTTRKGAVTGMSFGPSATIKRATVAGRGGMRLDAKSKGSFTNCLFAFEKGGIHVRAKSPGGIVSFKDCFYTPSFAMEWGARYPWTSLPFSKWSQENPKDASGCKPVEIELNASLNSGKIPEAIKAGMGCSRKLMQRYIEFEPKRQALIEKAKKMALSK